MDSILKEAEQLLNGDRAQDYGDIAENFSNIAEIFNVLEKEVQLKPKHIAKVMIAVKLGREKFKHKRDNLVDAAAYLEIYRLLAESEEIKPVMTPAYGQTKRETEM